MIEREVHIHERAYPVPMTMLIHAANSCQCDVHVCAIRTCESPGAAPGGTEPMHHAGAHHRRINVKSYDDMKRGFSGAGHMGSSLWFLFNGSDEHEATLKFERIFQV
ncbi:MAG: hypothetical protein LBR77_12120 [Lachnospiraceae bacterium]|jgi:hypothetical protein|nr:hypothetical protein [Lachnospiraceae bacterium]